MDVRKIDRAVIITLGVTAVALVTYLRWFT